MKATDFKKKMDKSFGVGLIITGLLRLVENEGYSPREAFELLEDVKRNTFHALSEVKRESESDD